MKIEVGGYVRTKDKILKVDSFEKDNRNIKYVCFTTGEIYTLELLDEITVKHSKNIIDLIEVGDYVNGILIEDIEEIDNKKVFYSNGEMIAWTNRDKGIETILTKEQYQSNCYTVERKEEC